MKKGLNLEEFMALKDPQAALDEVSFEHGLKLMEELVAKVESGSLPLDQAMLAYERGVELVGRLRGLISGAEEKLKVLQDAGKKPQV